MIARMRGQKSALSEQLELLQRCEKKIVALQDGSINTDDPVDFALIASNIKNVEEMIENVRVASDQLPSTAATGGGRRSRGVRAVPGGGARPGSIAARMASQF